MKSNAIKYVLEFPIQASPHLLYQYISTPSGLSEWFADNVNAKGERYVFVWEDAQEEAKLLRKKLEESVKFRWEAATEDTFFEIRISVDDITKDVSLVVTDFVQDAQDLEEAKLLWKNQINDLKHILGSI